MKILITRKIPEEGIEILQKHSEIELDYRQGPPLSNAELMDAIKDVDGIIPVIPDKITAEVINAAGDKLKVIATYSVGYDHIDLDAATSKKIYVGNTPGHLVKSVAEHTIGLMFAVSRRIIEADKFVRDGKYKYWDPMIFLGPQFSGLTIGIVGCGRIGRHVAKIAHEGLGMHILYTDVRPSPIADSMGGRKVELEELMEDSDMVSINCNLTEETTHLINEAALNRMKPTAFIVNTARGQVIDETALVKVLQEKKIAGAALDVFEHVPEISAELLEMRNVVFTPHIASATPNARIEMATMAAANVVDVLINNKPPANWVNEW